MALTDFIIMPGADYQAACDKLREKSGKTDLIKSGDLASEIEAVAGEKLPPAEAVSFSADQLDPDVRYSIGQNWFASVVERLRVMVNSNRDFTPEEIVYWLGRVTFIPQGYAESAFSLDFASGASGILPTVYKGTANSEFTLNFESSAVGALSE